MIESFENALQIVVLFFCVCAAVYHAIKTKSRAWTLLSFFYGSWLLGDVYWLVCLAFLGSTPEISVISDLSWCAAYLFLYLLLRQVMPPKPGGEKRLLPWLGFVFSLAMAVFYYSFYVDWGERYGIAYVLWGKALSNLIYGMLMGLLLFSAIRRLMDGRGQPGRSFLPAAVLVHCFLEYALWTLSCFFWETTPANPYYWCDLLLTASFLLLLMATKKAESEAPRQSRTEAA